MRLGFIFVSKDGGRLPDEPAYFAEVEVGTGEEAVVVYASRFYADPNHAEADAADWMRANHITSEGET